MFRYKNTIVRNDMEEMLRVNLPWDKLGGKSCLVTGANGMIATYMVYLLMSLVRDKGMDIRVVALSRDRKRAEELFADFLEDPHFELLIQDVCESIHREGGMDYIFHFAGNASPYYIQNDPVGIMKSNLLGTINVLELAREKGNREGAVRLLLVRFMEIMRGKHPWRSLPLVGWIAWMPAPVIRKVSVRQRPCVRVIICNMG